MNGATTALASVGSALVFTSVGAFYLTDSTGAVLWNPNTNGISQAMLLDTGNFVLYDSDDVPEWQSFAHPTDTLVPGQIIGGELVLWSKLTDSDFSRGRFTLAPQSDSNLVLYAMYLTTGERYRPAIWSNGWPNGTQLVFNLSGALYYHLKNDTGMRVTSAANYPSSDYYQHATLDPDGNFRLYAINKSANATWAVAGQLLTDGCQMRFNESSGVCGFNAYCNSDNKNQTRLDCECPPHYSFADPEHKYKGCMPDHAFPSCQAYQSNEFGFSVLQNTDWSATTNLCALEHDLRTCSNMRAYTCKELDHATKGFSEELGRGAFGTVYKGILESEPIIHVAVKKLDRLLKEGEKEFVSEIQSIGKTHHKNLVRLLGFCKEGPSRMLVYEYMSKGSLARFIFQEVLKPTWSQREQIAIGIARGLLYLHEDCYTQIMHCDIKPQNIILDDNLVPKISDFGLAKLLWPDQTRTYTEIRGTKGYVAPEWFKNTPVTAKIDVFSFGVLLLEIVCCRKNIENVTAEQEEKPVLTYWAHDCLRDSNVKALVECDMEAITDVNQVEKFVKVAIWCIQEEPSTRPSMREVVSMLEGIAPVLNPPLDTASF
ncbi:hypothetical protein LUZ60_017037 [Juncus effusus]|nr:hypothetical protein LUZ60_017037 [Juncus effusus]